MKIVEDKGGEAMETQKEKMTDMLVFVDSNLLYYERKWGIEGNPNKAVNWNFAAFFLGAFWFAYRKMYIWALLDFLFLFFGNLALFILLDAMKISSPGVQFFIWIVGIFSIRFLVGLYGNTLYYRHVQKRVQQIGQSPSLTPDMKVHMMERTGGVSGGAVVAVLLFFFLLGLIGYSFTQ
jgi:hypothetical protein